MEIAFKLNGIQVRRNIPTSLSLLSLLRDHLGMMGTKPGCNEGECGACTVLVNGLSVNSCLFPAVNVDGREVVSIEGMLRPDGSLGDVQQAIVEHGAVQCGFCTSGMVMNIEALKISNSEEQRQIPREEILKWMEGNLCRCTGYVKIVDAAESVLNKS